MDTNPATTNPNPNDEAANAKPIIVKDFKMLSDVAMGERFYVCTLNGKRMAFRIRPLNAVESVDVDKIDGNVRPPSRTDPKTGMTVFNEEDPDYKERLAAARKRKRAAVFRNCLLDLKLEGTNDEQVEWLYRNLPPGVIDELYFKILQITGNPFEDALFTSTVS